MKRLRRAGKIIATIWAAYFGFMAIGGIFGDDPGAVSDEWTWESTGVAIFVALAIFVTIWIWINYKKARWASIVIGLAFMVFACVSAGQNQFFAAMVSGFPFVLAGLFMLDYEK